MMEWLRDIWRKSADGGDRSDAERGRSWAAFEAMGLPDATDESYRHTDLRALFTAPRALGEVSVEVEGPGSGMVTVVGQGGATGFPVTFACTNQTCPNPAYPTAATLLNGALVQTCVLVHIPRGVHAAEPLTITFDYSGGVCFPRVLIVLDEGARADVAILHRGDSLVDFVREAVVARDARLTLTEVSECPEMVSNGYLVQAADSHSHSVVVMPGGDAMRADNVVDLTGPGAQADLHALWLASGDDRTDLNVTVRHSAPNCRSYQLVKGVASQRAVGAFTGMVHVAGDAQRTEALQQSRNLLVDDTARIYAEPRLEIYADDVKCSHGATVGQMDAEALFYMRQRGLSDADARRLQMQGFVHDVLSHIPNASVREHAARLAAAKI